MNLSSRLAKLSARATAAAPVADPGPRTDEDWLAAFAWHAAAGTAAAEPDFPRAVAGYRAAVAAGSTTGPAGLTDPAVDAAWVWAAAILLRALDGDPPVSAAEFAALAGWFDANADRLAARPGDELDLGDGVRATVAGLRHGVRQGVRATDAGTVAETLRRAKALYG